MNWLSETFTIHNHLVTTALITVTPIALYLPGSIASLGFKSSFSMSFSTISTTYLLTSFPRSSSFFDPSTSKVVHSFTQSSLSFRKMCPHNLSLFRWTTVAMFSVPYLCLKATQDSLSLYLSSNHSHLSSQCYFIFLFSLTTFHFRAAHCYSTI